MIYIGKHFYTDNGDGATGAYGNTFFNEYLKR